MPVMRPTSCVHSHSLTRPFSVYTHLTTSVLADRDNLNVVTTLDHHHLYTEVIPRHQAKFAQVISTAGAHLSAFEQLLQRLQHRLSKPELQAYDRITLTQRVTNHLHPLGIPPIATANVMALLNRPFSMNDQRLPGSGPLCDLAFSLDMPTEGPATLTLTGSLTPAYRITEQLIWEALIPDVERLRQISLNGFSSLRMVFPGQHDTIRTHIESELQRARVYTKRPYTYSLTSDRDPAALHATYDALLNHTPEPADLTDALALTNATLNQYR